MANKKKSSKKKVGVSVNAPVTKAAGTADVKKTENKGEEVKSSPAIVEEPTIKVRGAAVGGVKMMTQTEYDKYIASQK